MAKIHEVGFTRLGTTPYLDQYDLIGSADFRMDYGVMVSPIDGFNIRPGWQTSGGGQGFPNEYNFAGTTHTKKSIALWCRQWGTTGNANNAGVFMEHHSKIHGWRINSDKLKFYVNNSAASNLNDQNYFYNPVLDPALSC
jgi:hypothetical protein